MDGLDTTITDPDQSLSEEQSYRETMRGIRSYMGWTHIPYIDSNSNTSYDNPFAIPKLYTPGKVSVQLPTGEWLGPKLSKLNLTLTDGYPSCSPEAGGLQRDQFLKPRSQAKWYSCHSQQKSDTTETVTSWNTDSPKLNSAYLRIARQAAIATSHQPPSSQSHSIPQEILRNGRKQPGSICNQAAVFNWCLVKVQQDMLSQLKAIRVEHNRKLGYGQVHGTFD